MRTMYRAVYKVCFQYMSKYDGRDVCKFTVQKTKKGIKRRCISIVGVQLWNNVKNGCKDGQLILVFKRIIYKTIFEGYKCV